MDFKTCVSVLKLLPVESAVLLRGKHGIGKSQLVYQIGKVFAKELNVPFEQFVVERRLSQMQDGDMIGLPVLSDGSTRFAPPDWFLECCASPKLLFLDEINRATPEVMQSAFQLVLDRQLNGHKVHEKTRVYAAVNISSDYIVNEMDPALLDRFWIADLEPSEDDWFDWAQKNGIDETIYDFLKHYPSYLEHKDRYEPNKIYPSRRSWHKLSNCLTESGIANEPKEHLYFAACLGFVGQEAATRFRSFALDKNKELSALDVLDKFNTKLQKKIDGMGPEKWNILIDKIGDHCKKEILSNVQLRNLSGFMKSLPGEHMVHLWKKITEGIVDNLFNLHQLISPELLEAISSQKE